MQTQRNNHPRVGEVAVVFVSEHTGIDQADYATAAAHMATLVAQQPGFRGVDWVGDADGKEITISYWADDASAAAWRDHPEHRRIQGEGRGRWIKRYDLMVADITRGHRWPQ